MIKTNSRLAVAKWVVGSSLSSAFLLVHTSASIAQAPNITPAAPDAPATLNTPATPDAPASVAQTYALGAGDRLKLELFEVPEYSGEYQVLSDGTLNLPRVGVVSVQGLTLEQASEAISTRFAQYVRRPFVTLSLLEAGTLNIAIAGAVNRPGAYVVPREENAGATTVTQAIKLAGGITQSADIRNIQVRRSVPQADGSTQEIQVDLWQLLRTGDINQDPVLQNRDMIFIPTATALSPAEATELATASFSPDSMTVNVVGEVDNPGAIAIPPNTPLNQAILAAGGFNNRARRSSVELIRLNPDGTVSRQRVEVDLAQNINPETNPALRNYDTIIVGRSGLASLTDTLGSVLSPVTGVFSLFRILGF